MKHKFITKAGPYYGINEQKFLGKEQLKRFLLENENVKEELMQKLKEKILGTDKGEPEGVATDGENAEEIVPVDSTDEETAAAVDA